MADTSINWSLEAVKIAAPFIAAYLTYVFAVRKMQRENPEVIQRKKYESILSANQHAWSLIAFMAETENEFSIVRWKKNGQEKVFYFHPENAKKFMENMRRIFYDEGHGLFFSRSVTDAVYTYRSLIYGLLMANGENNELIILENKEQAQRLFALAETMRKAIRETIELHQRKLDLDTF